MPLPPVANSRIRCREIVGDETFVALDKDAGVVTQPGAGHKEDSLLNGLFALEGAVHERLGSDRDWGLLHRLDKDTSGIVLVARTKEGYDAIRAQFEERSIEKTYIAVCAGRLPSAEGVCRAPLNEVRRGEMKVSVPVQRGEACVTHWRTIGAANGRLVVACSIETGKLHQIRAHLAFLGAAIEGDSVYRPLLPPNTSASRRGSAPPLLRLHAWRIAFAHPVTGNRVEIESPLPKAMVESMNLAGGSAPGASSTLHPRLADALSQLRSPTWWTLRTKR